MADVADSAEDVLVERTGQVGRLILNRPAALNALTGGMIETISGALDVWESQGLRAITIESADERAFCAGGDIRRIRQNTIDGDHAASEQFFRSEYQLNARLGSFPVPVLALVDGICMGGGMGLSVHGPFRVISERASFAMPETKIGFFPDVGSTHFLPRLPGAVGRYLGLTGVRASAGDALDFGIATHACSVEDLKQLPAAIDAFGGPIEVLLRHIAADLPAEELARNTRRHRACIDWAFTAVELSEVEQRLEQIESGDVRLIGAEPDAPTWARSTLHALHAVSPQSLQVADRLIAWGRERTLVDCLGAELDVALEIIASHDFSEGVRSVLVDKDHAPSWSSTETSDLSCAGWGVDNPKALDRS